MALIKEDGTGVTGANTYASAADLVAYAEARGITIPATEAEQEVLLTKAMDYLETLDGLFMGYRVNGLSQVLLWPREEVYFSSFAYPNNLIPAELVKVQMVIAIAAMTIDLFPVASGVARLATRKTVGPITIEYSAQGAESSLAPIISQANALLNILFGSAGFGQMRVIRA